MNKTLELFKKYGLTEADELELDATDTAEQPPIQNPAQMTTEGEKFHVETLLQAFLHEPDDSESNIAKEEQKNIRDATEEEVKNIMSKIVGFLNIGVDSTKAALDDIQV